VAGMRLEWKGERRISREETYYQGKDEVAGQRRSGRGESSRPTLPPTHPPNRWIRG